MAKMTIVDVDLDVEEIITDDIKELTAQNEQDIQSALDEKKEVIERIAAKKQKDQAVTDKLEAIYALLVERHTNKYAVSMEEMLEIANPVITNNSALVSRLKNYLRKQKGNKYVLKRRMKNKKPVYELNPYNTAGEPDK